MILPRKREREMKEGAVFSIREILCPLLIIERAALKLIKMFKLINRNGRKIRWKIVRVESAKCENALVKETRCVITSVRNTGIGKAMDKRGKSERERAATCYRVKRRISIEFARKQEERRAEFSFTRAQFPLITVLRRPSLSPTNCVIRVLI